MRRTKRWSIRGGFSRRERRRLFQYRVAFSPEETTLMKQLITALALAFAATASFAASHAAAAPAKTPQQEKMAMCNKDAEGKKGDERKTFMKGCLGAKSTAAGNQREKMKMCNKDATGKAGDERKMFMKDCLSKKA
jgi:psiF repeat